MKSGKLESESIFTSHRDRKLKRLYHHKYFNINLNPITLSFDKKDFEQDFRLHFNTDAFTTLKIGVILTFILFSLYSTLDHIVFPDLTDKLLKTRAIEGIFLASLFSLLTLKKEYCIRNLHILSPILTMFTGLVLLKISSFYPGSSLVYVLYDAGFVLFITAAFTIFGNRFIFALLAVVILNIGIGIILYKQLEFMPFLFLP